MDIHIRFGELLIKTSALFAQHNSAAQRSNRAFAEEFINNLREANYIDDTTLNHLNKVSNSAIEIDTLTKEIEAYFILFNKVERQTLIGLYLSFIEEYLRSDDEDCELDWQEKEWTDKLLDVCDILDE